MDEFIDKTKSIKSGHKYGQLTIYIQERTKDYLEQCKKEGKSIDINVLHDLRKQWELEFRKRNGL